METFTPTVLRGNSSKVFNSVQSNGSALIESKSRPNMVLILESEYKKAQLITGDSHLQQDLLEK